MIISQKHGVNPSIPVCFWCGKDKNEIILFGELKNDAEAPMKTVVDYEPCDECKANFARGVTVIEAEPTPVKEGFPSLNKSIGTYPTGRFLVLKPEAFNVPKKAGEKVCMIPQDFSQLWDRLNTGEKTL